MHKKYFSLREAKSIGKKLGLDWKQFDVRQFCMGLNLELQRGWVNSSTHLMNADPLATARVVLSRLREIPDYYTRLGRLLQEAGREYGPRLFTSNISRHQVSGGKGM